MHKTFGVAHTIAVKKTLGRSAATLAVIGIISKVIGALYRVPLTNTVGAEGMGLYQMVFPVYTVLLAFCGGGVTCAVSRVVAKYSAHGDERAARRAVKIAFVPLLIISVILTMTVVVFRDALSRLLGNGQASLCYLALSPSLLFAGGTAVVRGYFQGKNNMLPSGVSQLLEQGVKLAAGLFLARLLLRYGVRYAVFGALSGVTASEAVCALYLGIRYAGSVGRRRAEAVSRRRTFCRPLFEDANGMTATDGMLRREILSLSLPIMLGALVLPLTQVADSALVINLLAHGGAGRKEATSLFGLLVGPVGTLINMPTVILSSVTAAFLPALTSDLERGGDGKRITASVSEFVLMFVIPVTAAFMLFPRELCGALYGRGLTEEQLDIAARLLRVQAVSVFYAGVFQVGATVLQTRGAARKPTVYLAVGGAVKTALTPALVSVFGIYGGAAATAACYCVAALLTVRCAARRAGFGVSVRNAVIMPAVFSALGACAFSLAGLTAIPEPWRTAMCCMAFFIVYAVGMTASGALRFIMPHVGKARGGRKSAEKISE